MTLRTCVICGELSPESRCDEHRLPTWQRKGTARQRGYDTAWDRLSRRARRLQPWCADQHLGSCRGPLTCDHLPSAWERKVAGLPLRLQDVEPVCQGHNDARGTSRPGSERAATPSPLDPPPTLSGPRGKAESENEIGSHFGGAS